MANKLKEPVVEEQVVEEKPVKKKAPSKISKNITKFLNSYGIFSRYQVTRLMPFILFIALLIIGYIANSYFAEGMIRDIDKTKVELKEKRAEYISIMSQLMYQSNQSEVAKALEPYQIKETTEPPGKIFIAETKNK